MISWWRWLGSVCKKKQKTESKLTRREFLTQPLLYGIFMGNYLTPHFTVDEMKCKGTGICTMDEVFMELLEQIRQEYGKPMIVTSGYRAPEYNAKIAKSGSKGPHTYGQAADLHLIGADANAVIKIALELGMTGIGIKQKGPHKGRFVHLDNLPNGEHPRPWIWSY